MSTFSSYQCPHCLSFVNTGDNHTCQPNQYYSLPLYIDNIALARIANALEKLVELLTKAEETK